jgi:3-oxoacyl-[acyl-carrier protein] reductase
MSGRVAVVVGGSGQIGRSTLSVLRDKGYIAIGISKLKPDNYDNEPGVEYLFGDMTKLDQIERCCADIILKYQKVDLLVNVIGKNIKRPLNDITEKIWSEVIDANLKSVFFLCRTFANTMIRSGGGTIINFASIAGIRAIPQSPHYIAAKAGVIALSEFFAKVYAPSVRVNCIAPGFILTKNHQPENYPDHDDILDRIPMKQLTTIEEIIEAIIFLAGSHTITGHTIVLDGGLIL